ncbi:class I SAM-dependent methyltransferase [Steroidobacter cummioxidans]|uniref:class I SAM-dependent methyltransferase n=1 Tax=Steroidobacter cummioxidans TaxID=1803913 RepID=UPI000E314A98|nr:class I SAM-dependent methyltransferase [Steroidobacter cummioxidans]
MIDRSSQDHWESVYRTKRSNAVSWFSPHLGTSMQLLELAGLSPQSRVIDIGAGASTLVDDLLDRGLTHITAVDIAENSLEIARARLGPRAESVQWIVADVTKLTLPAASIDLWHDRATLHFLIDAEAVRHYVRLATESIAAGGHAVIGGFAADGPERCSNLPVARRDPEDIAALFGNSFTLVQSRREIHRTPSGSSQPFAFALLRKVG